MAEKSTDSTPDRPPRQARVPLETPDAWAAFSHPDRLELMACINGLGEASVAEIARATDRSADGLYRHIRILLDGGLIEEIDIRRVGRQTETVYRLTSETPVADVDMMDADARVRMVQLMRKICREAGRRFERAMDTGLCRNADGERNTWVSMGQAWLDDDDLRDVERRLNELYAFFAERQERRPGSLHSCAVVMSPVHRERPFDARGSRRQEDMLAECGGCDRNNASE